PVGDGPDPVSEDALPGPVPPGDFVGVVEVVVVEVEVEVDVVEVELEVVDVPVVVDVVVVLGGVPVQVTVVEPLTPDGGIGENPVTVVWPSARDVKAKVAAPPTVDP